MESFNIFGLIMMKWIFFGEVLYNMFRIIMLILIDLFELVVFVINI